MRERLVFMKRIWLVAALALIFVLLAGCAQGAQTEVTETAPAGPVVVKNVDELLAAIGPDKEILMEPGTYDLYWAKDYAISHEEGYYTWEQMGDGCQLVIRGVQNLTIRGSGRKETQLITEPRFANVLVLKNCYNVTMEDFTAGHTSGSECVGGVVNLLGCADVQIKNLGLYGCGTVGIHAELCSDIGAEDCEIYECSSSGIWASRTDGLTVRSCTVRDIGKNYYGGGNLFWMDSCTDVAVEDCQIRDNWVPSLFGFDLGQELTVKNCTFARNQVNEAVFETYSSGMILDGCTFEENTIRNWFSGRDVTVIDGIGKTWTEEMLDVQYNADGRKQEAGAQTSVTVETVDELLAAIGPDTEILLKDGFYDLSTASGYGSSFSDYYCWTDEFDGPQLMILDVNNLTIRSESGDRTKCTLSALPRYANVLSFRNCSNITVAGITAGHTMEPGECMGGVLNMDGCDGVLVENCGLYGCGILGIQAQFSSDFTVRDCEVYECSYGGIAMADMMDIAIESCTFRDLGGPDVSFYNCGNVTLNGERVQGDYVGSFGG